MKAMPQFCLATGVLVHWFRMICASFFQGNPKELAFFPPQTTHLSHTETTLEFMHK